MLKKALGKELFAECYIFDTRQRASLPSVIKTLGKETLCRVSKIKHSTKSVFAECFLLPRVFCVALGKKLLCRVPKKTLDKEPNSSSANAIIKYVAHAKILF
jgi:hypothetical protein